MCSAIMKCGKENNFVFSPLIRKKDVAPAARKKLLRDSA
jgi:hypothetical protein